MVAERIPTPTPARALLDAYALALDEGGYAEATVRAYLADVTIFKQYLTGDGPEPDWTKLRPVDLIAFVTREKRRVAGATVQRRCHSLRHFLGFLVLEGVLPRVLLGAVPRLKAQAPATRVLTAEQLAALQEAPGTATPCGLRDAALLSVLVQTGMRISDAVALDDADWVPGLDEAGRAALERYRAHARPELIRPRPEQTALFVNHRGERLNRAGAWLRIKAHAEAAGLPAVSARTLRRTKAVALTAAGATAIEVGLAFGCTSAVGYRARAVVLAGAG